MILAVTGHRPDKLGGYGIYPRLGAFAASVLQYHGLEGVITGMALGWDQAVAEACIDTGIPFVAAIPCTGQESRWPASAREKYYELLSHASEIIQVTGKPYSTTCMQARNEWMVDSAGGLLALWDGSKGGTYNCVKYAEGRVPLENIWGRWVQWRDAQSSTCVTSRL